MSTSGADTAVAAVIFDLDGVVRNWDHSLIAAAEQRHGLPAGSIHQEAFARELLTAVTTGHITDEAWRCGVASSLAARYGDAAHSAVAEWSEPCGSVNAAVLRLVRHQRQTRPVALFSNATTRLPRDLAALRLDTEFDAVFNSSVLGVAKPDERAFEAALAALGCRPTECVFIDDTEGHVAAAGALGLRSHHFQTAARLADFLSRAAP